MKVHGEVVKIGRENFSVQEGAFCSTLALEAEWLCQRKLMETIEVTRGNCAVRGNPLPQLPLMRLDEAVGALCCVVENDTACFVGNFASRFQDGHEA